MDPIRDLIVRESAFAHQTPQSGKVGKWTRLEILLSEGQHLPTKPHSRSGKVGKSTGFEILLSEGQHLPTLLPPHSRFPIPDSRFPIPDSRFPIPDSRFPLTPHN
ncbi:MAG: hypothetical protein F6K63_18000 [Moorea sp. SIO1G6]|uniref:hypothetical protein n=1 Tax=Moorena sp. SIO1G6 TaxID=2607840 RepID=UPI0013C12747|nr:hypothetical protein [Moorena sp. SIO1G6]NET66174.1 hypothetical protein [Moorena sp. SIO1G6]